jgi:hypothetical protein
LPNRNEPHNQRYAYSSSQVNTIIISIVIKYHQELNGSIQL